MQEEDYDRVATYCVANFIISHWLEPTTTIARLNVSVFLLSATNENSFKVNVLPNGRILEIIVNFPLPLLDMSLLHILFLINPTVYDQAEVSLAINRFQRSLRTRRAHMKSTVSNPTQIYLPFRVILHITFWDGMEMNHL